MVRPPPPCLAFPHSPYPTLISLFSVHGLDILPSALLLPRHKTEHHAHILDIAHRLVPRLFRAYLACPCVPASGEEIGDMAGECGYRGIVPGCFVGLLFAFYQKQLVYIYRISVPSVCRLLVGLGRRMISTHPEPKKGTKAPNYRNERFREPEFTSLQKRAHTITHNSVTQSQKRPLLVVYSLFVTTLTVPFQNFLLPPILVTCFGRRAVLS